MGFHSSGRCGRRMIRQTRSDKWRPSPGVMGAAESGGMPQDSQTAAPSGGVSAPLRRHVFRALWLANLISATGTIVQGGRRLAAWKPSPAPAYRKERGPGGTVQMQCTMIRNALFKNRGRAVLTDILASYRDPVGVPSPGSVWTFDRAKSAPVQIRGPNYI